MITAFGKLIWQNGDEYVGFFKNGLKHGSGTYTWLNGDKYIGKFEDGKRNGFGTYLWADGDSYVGHWKNGLKHGYGTYFEDEDGEGSGETTVAIWERGKVVQYIS